ncbi:hypothetical protein C3747_35g259 [Trypanosoma cruzi]|uniref:Uncharacterized protein n=2 Tax=Trypanosoma cruzi TaxID=5693 RepID=Q4DSQ6_TRYCC|nr:hypothetical protein, conserved [Trypanosoma cruzi]EAN95550.1 hypothetical protein, conserved [Trypanosoma cruzi]PWV14476.1 hypothetical protein C3747_35g259 [Trypanosoma cruzi]RNC38062.1 putative ankyrin repeat protein [Trypanosoma cruzi]|eukprot:XP_817401.1 hypothetical protein [Trypanosoma cruzi strain CL Brener]
MSSDRVASVGEATACHVARIVSRLEGRSFDSTHRDEGGTGECGPFMQRLLPVVEETRVDRRLDDVFRRAHSIFEPLSQATVAAGDDAEALMADVASRASRLVVEEVLQPCDSTKSSPSSFSESPLRTQQAAWCRTGQLSLGIIRESTCGFYFAPSTGANSAPQRVPVLLQRRIPWRCKANDGSGSHDAVGRDCDADSGREEGDAPMLSGVTLQWGAVLGFLQLLSRAVGLTTSVDGEYTAVSSLTEGEHSLLHIVADSIIVMMERNHALLQEARDMNQLGMAAEVLIIAANNFAWIRQRCQRIPMANAREVEEILTQSLAGVLQDIIDGFVEEIQYILSMYMTSSGGGGGGRQRVVTYSFLATRVTAICRLSNGLVHLLPRQEVMSIVLEQSLRPVVEQLLVGDKQNDVERGGITTGVLKRVGDIFLPADAFLRHDAAHVESGVDENGSGTLAQRLSEVLQILESEEAFGAAICQRSPPFRTLRRLLPTMTF